MKKRIEKLQSVLKEKKLDAVVITSRPNTFYMSGFAGSSSIIIITTENKYFATDFRYIEHATELCRDFFEVSLMKSTADAFLIEKFDEYGLKKVGFEENDVSQGRYTGWSEKLNDVEFSPMQSEITKIRMIKDTDEIKKLQTAVTLGDEAFMHILKFLKPGIRENEVAAEIEYFMRKNGASAPSFETIVASGIRSSMPHGHAGNKIIEAGDPVTMDFGALVDGYCSDMTRTIFVGKPDQRMKDIYNIVLKAQVESQAGAYSGRTGQEIDAISRKIIYEAGYEGCYGHGLGHSVGIEVHEEPRFNTKDQTIMENGMVMTVEPGIYVENYGGVRIENMIVINDENPICLTRSTKEMLIL